MPRKNIRRILLLVLILAVTGMLVFFNSGPGYAQGGVIPLEAASHVQANTPTPAPREGSTAGSTDGIMWMGAAIAVIILLPVLLRMSTLSKS